LRRCLGLNISDAKADTCGQLVARVIEGAAYYKMTSPKFEPTNRGGAEGRYWSISIFDDVRAMFICYHGYVGTFAADANDDSGMASLHVHTLIGIGLYGCGMEWHEAILMRDNLVRTAKAAESHIAELPIDDGKASLIISAAGIPSFQIDAIR
jgi:hypothetical protein